jgi:hypothetical protein
MEQRREEASDERVANGHAGQHLLVLEVFGVEGAAARLQRAGGNRRVVDRDRFVSSTARSCVRTVSGSTRQTCRNDAKALSIAGQGASRFRLATATNSLRTCTLIVPPSAKRSSARLDLAMSSESR